LWTLTLDPAPSSVAGRGRIEAVAIDPGKLLEEALKLSPEARAALAASLLDSLDQGTDEGAEAAWSAEIAKRVRELESGAVTPVPWSEARRQILGH
jgi:putative addiction module component (TIGR02574 family)